MKTSDKANVHFDGTSCPFRVCRSEVEVVKWKVRRCRATTRECGRLEKSHLALLLPALVRGACKERADTKAASRQGGVAQSGRFSAQDSLKSILMVPLRRLFQVPFSLSLAGISESSKS